MKLLPRFCFGIAAVCVFAVAAQPAQETLGDKIKKIFAPTPTPAPRKHRKTTSTKKKKRPSPSPSPSVKPKPKSNGKKTEKAETPSPTPSPSPKKRKKISPAPEESPSPAAKKRRKASPTPSPSPTETPTPTPASSPSRKKPRKGSPTPTATETPEPSPDETASPEETETPEPTPTPKKKGAPVSISPEQIVGYAKYPADVQRIVELALELAGRGLDYKYGSADPETGGMDCSGFVHYVLTNTGVPNVPRDSSEQYNWVRRAGTFEPVISRKESSYELENMVPGDLLFWTGTYQIERDPPITHAMIYLGREKGTNQRIMIGASDGRTYRGESRYGVSVFDFKIPAPARTNEGRLTPTFVGYGHIPGSAHRKSSE